MSMTRPNKLLCAAIIGITSPLWLLAAVALIVGRVGMELVVMVATWRSEK